MNKVTERKLKVGYASKIKGNAGRTRLEHTPKLILQGNWFAKAGFAIGEATRIIVADSFIQIVKEAKHA